MAPKLMEPLNNRVKFRRLQHQNLEKVELQPVPSGSMQCFKSQGHSLPFLGDVGRFSKGTVEDVDSQGFFFCPLRILGISRTRQVSQLISKLAGNWGGKNVNRKISHRYPDIS